MILFIGGVFTGISFSFIALCIFSLCQSAKRGDLYRMPDQSPFEPK